MPCVLRTYGQFTRFVYNITHGRRWIRYHETHCTCSAVSRVPHVSRTERVATTGHHENTTLLRFCSRTMRTSKGSSRCVPAVRRRRSLHCLSGEEAHAAPTSKAAESVRTGRIAHVSARRQSLAWWSGDRRASCTPRCKHSGCWRGARKAEDGPHDIATRGRNRCR